jgi:cell division septation protein DedD
MKVLGGLLALVAVATLGWVVWIAYDEGVRTGTVKTVPVIRADAGEIKRKPDQPGGLEVPHQGILVFGRLAPGQANEPVERLLPLPEVPIKLPVSGSSRPPEVKAVGPTTVRPDTEIVAALTPKLIEPAPAKKVPSVPTVDSAEIVANTRPPAGVPLEAQTDLEVKTPAPPPVAKEKAQSPTKVVVKTPDSAPEPAPVEKQPVIPPEAAWRIQLVALNNPKDAERVWGRLQKVNSDLLGGLTLRVLAAKLKKGTFYRVQAGPLASRAVASALCGTLKSRKQDCLVVAPKR